MIENGNKSTGGLLRAIPLFYGIVGEPIPQYRAKSAYAETVEGFTRFTAGWYAVLIRKRASVALIGGHYIFHCEESIVVPIHSKPERNAEEARFAS